MKEEIKEEIREKRKPKKAMPVLWNAKKKEKIEEEKK